MRVPRLFHSLFNFLPFGSSNLSYPTVNERGNLLDFLFRIIRGMGIVFACGGSGNARRQICGKTRNQILHQKELKRAVIACY